MDTSRQEESISRGSRGKGGTHVPNEPAWALLEFPVLVIAGTPVEKRTQGRSRSLWTLERDEKCVGDIYNRDSFL